MGLGGADTLFEEVRPVQATIRVTPNWGRRTRSLPTVLAVLPRWALLPRTTRGSPATGHLASAHMHTGLAGCSRATNSCLGVTGPKPHGGTFIRPAAHCSPSPSTASLHTGPRHAALATCKINTHWGPRCRESTARATWGNAAWGAGCCKGAAPLRGTWDSSPRQQPAAHCRPGWGPQHTHPTYPGPPLILCPSLRPSAPPSPRHSGVRVHASRRTPAPTPRAPPT